MKRPADDYHTGIPGEIRVELMPMTLSVAMMHHHLRGGGVTQIIRQQCVLLGRAGIAVTVFSGEEGPDDFPAEVVCVPGLGYASDTTTGKRDVNHSPDSAANTSLKAASPPPFRCG